MNIRPAGIDDASHIAAATRCAFDEMVLKTTIYGMHGITQFIRNQIEVPFRMSDTFYTVAEISGHIAGFIELRRLRDSLFLNYIAVTPEYRRRGIAQHMLGQAIKAARQDHHTELALDVFVDNAPAVTWYSQLGFRPQYRVDWLSAPLQDVPAVEGAMVLGYPQAQVQHERFGFSQFTLSTPMGEYTIGRIGSDWFRITQPAALRDGALLFALKRLDAHRRALILAKQEEMPVPALVQSSRLRTACRMSVDLRLLLSL